MRSSLLIIVIFFTKVIILSDFHYLCGVDVFRFIDKWQIKRVPVPAGILFFMQMLNNLA